MLSEEQTNAIKNQLIEHVDRSFPESKKQYAKEQILKMDAENLEEFLVKNNLVPGQSSSCVFCSIISREIPSYKIDENDDAFAVLEINPASRGHVLIIPKKHEGKESEIPENAQTLAKKISKKIQSALKPKQIENITSSAFGHSIINLLPIYSDESISSRRQPAKKEELEEIQKLLSTSEKPKIAKEKKSKLKKEKSFLKKAEEVVEKIEERLWLPKRIP